MHIQVHLKTGCKPIVHEEVVNTYMKDNLFCVRVKEEGNKEAVNTYMKDNLFCLRRVKEEGNDRIYKYPVIHIFRIIEN